MLSLYKFGDNRPYWKYFSMDGVFMQKLTRFVWSLVLLLVLFCIGGLLADRQHLRNGIIRLHVVAASDDQEDQAVKLAVKDAVVDYLNDQHIYLQADKDNAYAFIQMHLHDIEMVANTTLMELGDNASADVSLGKTEFGTRNYDTFSLPAGVYDSLQVTIGEGSGQNWWCVIFPSLCAPNNTAVFCDVAVSAGMNNGLAGALSNDQGGEVRFFFLDCIGKIENLFHFQS